MYASRKRCPFSCRLNSMYRYSLFTCSLSKLSTQIRQSFSVYTFLDCAAGPEESSTSEVQRVQKFCRRNCWVFLASHKSECQLTVESAERCRTRGNSRLPGREAPAQTVTGEPYVPLWTWHALGWAASGVRAVPAWYDNGVACQWSVV